MFIQRLLFRPDEYIKVSTSFRDGGKGFIELSDAGLETLLLVVQRAEQEMLQLKQTGKQRRHRRKNLNLTNKDAERVRRLAQQFPDLTQEELSIKAGLYEDTINKCPTLFWIADWQAEARLSQIVKFARIEMDRAANGCFSPEEIDQMRITNRFKLGEE